jgi:hypothetical protein
MASTNMNFNSSDEESQSTSSLILSGEPVPTRNILRKVNEMKNICVDGVALTGLVMESLAEKIDKMHHNIKRKMSDQIEEIKLIKVKLSEPIK